LLAALSACGKAREPAPSLEPSARPNAAKPAEGASASERLIGRWHLDLAATPDSALGEDMLKLKQRGQTLRLEYEFDAAELTVTSFQGNVTSQQRFHYEILEEHGEELQLKRIDSEGMILRIAAFVGNDTLRIGRDKTQVTLMRSP
jgi:hypothetical protein